MPDLGTFLRAQAADPVPGWNCSTMPADWCVSLGHPDFAAAWRHIVDCAECEATPRAAGGLMVLWWQGIGSSLQFIDPEAGAEAGDIAVVRAHGLEAGAIFTGQRWALRKPRGLLFAGPSRVYVLAQWRP